MAEKPSTALRSIPDWLSSSRALASTSLAAVPVALAAVVTPPIWASISLEVARHVDKGVGLLDARVEHLQLHQIAGKRAGDAQTKQATPTRMPSLGAIVRLLNFKGGTRGFQTRGRFETVAAP